jgi:hypothetical protein
MVTGRASWLHDSLQPHPLRARASLLQLLKAIAVNALFLFLCSADATSRLFGAVALGNAPDLALQEGIVSGSTPAPRKTVRV